MLKRFFSLNKGLSLIECALAVLIAGTAIVTVLEISTNTIRTTMASSDNRLASLLASELMAIEVASAYQITESPMEDGYRDESGEQEVDTERYGEQYKDFRYSVTKTYEEIDIESELSDDADEEEEYPVDEEEEELPVVKVVRIKLVIVYPPVLGQDEQGKLTVETYIKPEQISLAAEEESNQGG
ncbi:MAG: hypothetical protein K8S87_10325 [Planctomycetes bacterium]|nr:hypothetical protein [Planctomycetota bacterium]